MTPPATDRTIPVIDVGGYLSRPASEKETVAQELRSALEHVGFFTIVGHGVDWSLVNDAYAETGRFFDLPDARKQAIAIESGEMSDLLNARGYIGLTGGQGYGTTAQGRSSNIVESLYFDYEPRGRNRWPSDLGGFRERILAYFEAVDSLARRLLPLYAIALGIPDEDYFTPFFRDATVGLRISHYPPAGGDSDPDQWGIAPHTDRSFMTLLPTNDVCGLQVRPARMQWMDVPVIPGAFLVNSGDTLRRWSNDRFLSTPHRVGRPRKHRYAIPYFFGPSADQVLEPLPSCVSSDRPPRYEPITFGEFDREFLQRSYRPQDARLQD